MNPKEYELMFQVEDHHWWYLGMEKITRSLLGFFYHPGLNLKILDAGCGTGAAMASYLCDYGAVTGVDISALALRYSGLRGVRDLSRASVVQLPFSSGSFDLVTSFDVLYERAVGDDALSVREFCRVLRKGGRVLLRLPAYNWLRGSHDLAVHTARRYTTGKVAQLFKLNGLVSEYLSYANTFLFPIALGKRLCEKVFPPRTDASDLALEAGRISPLLQSILGWEAALIPHTRLPFGLSVFAVGRKL